MPAPRRLRVLVGDFNVSAFILEKSDEGKPKGIVCKTCAPKATKLKPVADVIQLGFESDFCYTIWECRTCKTQWAVPYEIQHNKGVA